MFLRLMLCLLVVFPAFAQPKDEEQKAIIATAHAVPSQTALGTVTIPQPFLVRSEGGNSSTSLLEWMKVLVPVLAALGGVSLTQLHGQRMLRQQLEEAARIKKWEVKRDTYRQFSADLRTLVSTYYELSRYQTDDMPPGDGAELDFEWHQHNRIWRAARERLAPEQSALMRTAYSSLLSVSVEGSQRIERFVSEFPSGKGWGADGKLCDSLATDIIDIGKRDLGF